MQHDFLNLSLKEIQSNKNKVTLETARKVLKSEKCKVN